MFTQKFPYLCASIIGAVIFPLLIYTCKYSVDTRKGSGSVSADMYTRGVRYTIQPQIHFKEKVLKSCLLSTCYEEIMFVIQFVVWWYFYYTSYTSVLLFLAYLGKIYNESCIYMQSLPFIFWLMYVNTCSCCCKENCQINDQIWHGTEDALHTEHEKL